MRKGLRGGPAAAVAFVIVAAALVSAASTPAAATKRAPIRLSGTTTLQAVNVQQHCRFSRGPTAAVLIADCTQFGTYAGKPGRAGAAYGWRWELEVGANGTTTGFAPETGELALNFGARGILRVKTKGRQEPVGTPDANHAQGRTTGTWAYKSGTKLFAKRKGTGTFTFDTERTGPDTFQVARIAIRGTLR